MLTRHDLSELSKAHESDMVLSVYIAREGSDPGNRAGWRLRVDAALGTIRAGLEQEAPGDLEAFERASERIATGLGDFGRVLPQEGWSGFATADGLVYSEVLPFAPTELVRWRQGIYAAPYIRALKNGRPVALALLDRWHARLFEYQEGQLSLASELEADRSSVDASDVGMSKRASFKSSRPGKGATRMTGTSGATATDYAQRMLEEEAKRLRKQVVEAILEMTGDGGGVVLGGTPKAIAAVRRDLEEKLEDRIAEVPQLSFDSPDAEISAVAASAASELTLRRQARLLEASTETPERGSTGWNRTYRALAAGAVDTLLVSRNLIESSPDDADRLVRLALAQGAEVEEIGDELGARLWAEAEGLAARLRFRMAVA